MRFSSNALKSKRALVTLVTAQQNGARKEYVYRMFRIVSRFFSGESFW